MGLEPMAPSWQLSQFNRMKIPFTKIYSPSFLPKPRDWGDHVDIAGYIFHDDTGYTPPQELIDFLEAEGKPPIYIGFGSMTFPDESKIFGEVFGGLAKAGLRAVICRGWS